MRGRTRGTGGTRRTPRFLACGAATLLLLLAIPAPGAQASDFWDEVRTPGLSAYRDAVARGSQALGDNRPREALELASAAIAQLPARAPAHVLAARALAKLGEFSAATDTFERALALDAAALGDLESGTAAASAAVRCGRHLLAQRVLLRLMATGESLVLQRSARILAAHVLLLSGPAHLRDAIRLYRESSRDGDHSDATLLGFALALHRSGDLQGAAILAGRVVESTGTNPREMPAWLPEGEQYARQALLLEALDRGREAHVLWKRAAHAGGPWAQHAATTAGAR